MNIEKTFNSTDINFLIFTIEKYSFSKNFILWIMILLRGQEISVVIGGTTIKYFSVGRGVFQGDQISTFFIYFNFRGFIYSY